MHKHKSAIACGSFAIIVSLCSGCATQPSFNRIPMATQDLNHFRIDCARRDQQIAFLQAQRVNRDDQFEARVRTTLKPWEKFTSPAVYAINSDVAYNNPNKYINYLLWELSQC